MEHNISREKLQDFLNKQCLPTSPGWESLFHCLFVKQSCPNLTTKQQQETEALLMTTMTSASFTPASFLETTKSMDHILNAPYIAELQQAIDETSTLINHFKSISGRQCGAVGKLEKLAIKTVQSNSSPKQMVSKLKSAFTSLVHFMEEEAKSLENLSKTDMLTKLANRRGFDEYIEEHCQPGKGDSLNLMMLDIDHFKAFNDNFGHLVGDEVLTLVASIIAKLSSRDNGANFAARYGGEEFVIIMPSASTEKCLQLAESLRNRIQRYPLVIRNSTGDIIKKDVHITISIGVASMHPLWLKDQQNSCTKLLKAADQAMYKAKKRGRNMVCQHKVYKDANGRLASVIL